MTLGENHTLDLAVKELHLLKPQRELGGVVLLTLNERNHRAEAGCALLHGHILHFTQHTVDVAVAVVRHAAIACRVHTGSATQRVNLQSRVVAEAVVAIMVGHIARLHLGITLQGVGRFGYILMAANVVQTQYLNLVAHYLAQFLQLMGIIGSKNYLFHRSIVYLRKQSPHHFS